MKKEEERVLVSNEDYEKNKEIFVLKVTTNPNTKRLEFSMCSKGFSYLEDTAILDYVRTSYMNSKFSEM